MPDQKNDDALDIALDEWNQLLVDEIDSTCVVFVDTLEPDLTGYEEPVEPTDAERAVIMMTQVDYESSNGGLGQMYFDRPACREYTISLFDRFGLPETAMVVKKAFEWYASFDEEPPCAQSSGNSPYIDIGIEDTKAWEWNSLFYETRTRECPAGGSNPFEICRAIAQFVVGHETEFPHVDTEILNANPMKD